MILSHPVIDNKVESGLNISNDNTEKSVEILPIDANHHVVQKGETLYRISKKYKLTTLQIKTLNDLETNMSN